MQRVLQNSAIVGILLIFLYWFIETYDVSLRDPRFLDGWILFIGLLVQILFHFRKRSKFLGFGKAKTWLRFHVYFGFFLIAVFALHTDFSLPDTTIEWVLWSLFVIVSVSGVIGLYLTQNVPQKLQDNAVQVTFENIPTVRHRLASEVTSLAMASAQQDGKRSISNLYLNTLHSYFKKPQNFFSHLGNSQRPLRRIQNEIHDMERYQDDKGREILKKIENLVMVKNNLDFQYAHQGVLHVWLFVHVPATYGLAVIALFHVALAYAYSSGVR